MQRFSARAWEDPQLTGCLQIILAGPAISVGAHAFIYGHFHPRRHRMAANRYRASRAIAFKVWQQETCAQVVA